MAKKKRVGIVISSRPQKTIVVSVQTRYQHSKYSKILTKTKKFMAHDELNICKAGDLVLIEESSPYSKQKAWVFLQVLKPYRN
jgi:small subunit ribosomal protein S17